MNNSVWNKYELSEIRNVDRLIPSQEILKKSYTDPEELFHENLERVILSVQKFKSVTDKFDIELKPGFSYASMGADIGTLYFYQYLVKSSNYKSILEFGTYIGVSTLFWAEAVGTSGKVKTVEIGEEFCRIAKNNFEKNKAKNIEIINEDAVNAIKKFRKNKETFDCIFIDAAKEVYDELLKLSIQCLKPGGTILIDDVFFQGEVLNKTIVSEKALGVERCLNLIKNLVGQKTILPIGNGLLLFRPF